MTETNQASPPGGPILPPDHPLRFDLNNEVHARPPEALEAPLRLSYLTLISDPTKRDEATGPIRDLAERYSAVPAEPGTNHYSADLGPFRVKWEQHTEFSRYMFITPGAVEKPFSDPPINTVPHEWLADLGGQVVVATHATILPKSRSALNYDQLSSLHFGGNALVGASIGGGAATALTDCRIHGDGFSRLLVYDQGMTPRQAGRTLQRLLEIETYRMMALLAFPVARELSPYINRSERELVQITTALTTAGEMDEPVLLDRLTRLQAGIESRRTDTQFRFSAARAYYQLVRRRIDALREERIQGLQTFREFTERRLAPAMDTCESTAARHEALSQHVARATQLLSTRVEIASERQNRGVLESMNRRARLQLRLQETVEGLSAAAITYYVVGLVGYAAKGLKTVGMPINPDVTMAVSIPIVATIAWLGIRRIRAIVRRTEE